MKKDFLDILIDKFFDKIEVLISNRIEPTIIVHDIKELNIDIIDGLCQSGIRGMILDVDETLRYDGNDISDDNIDWLISVSAKMKVSVVSNGYDKCVEELLKQLCINYYPLSFKPNTRNIKKALKSMEVGLSSAIIVGDKYFDDMYAGNKLGMKTCLVKK